MVFWRECESNHDTTATVQTGGLIYGSILQIQQNDVPNGAVTGVGLDGFETHFFVGSDGTLVGVSNFGDDVVKMWFHSLTHVVIQR